MSVDHEVDAGAVANRVAKVRERVARAGGIDVEVIAVTKAFPATAVLAALEAGLTDVGENYAQELIAKVDSLGSGAAAARWHFIGRLQRNKVRSLAASVALWQSVDRSSLAGEIAARQPGGAVLVQLNLSEDPGKGGCRVDEGPALVAHCRSLGLDVRGLMGVGPGGPPEAAREGFRRLVAQADELDLAVRSIGMSGDLEVAVEEGATMVRIGRDLFGPRPMGLDVI